MKHYGWDRWGIVVGCIVFGWHMGCSPAAESRASEPAPPAPVERALASGERSASGPAGAAVDAGVDGGVSAAHGHGAGGADATGPTPRLFLGSGPDEDVLLAHLQRSPIQRMRSVGNSSVVLKLALAGGPDAALKLPSVDREQADLAEIGAYRLARLLGMDNVPPVASRKLSQLTLRRRLQPPRAWPLLNGRIVWDAERNAQGAAIHWVAGMQDVPKDAARGLARWLNWIETQGEVPAAGRALAADLSNMLVFDYLIGNWDRFSGANIQLDASGQRLIVRDHDVAFPARLSPELQRRLLERVLRVRRFSERTLAAVQRLDAPALARALAEDPRTRGSLSEARVRGVLERRVTLLSHVAALMRQHGSEQVLAFP